MIPSKTWFPGTLQDRAAWYANFSTQIETLGPALGLTAGEITSITNDSLMMTFLASTSVTIDGYVDGVRNFRRIITEGDIGNPTPGFPADLALGAAPASSTGMFERLDGFVKRIRVAPAYTDETGGLLGIIPSGGGGPHVPIGEIPPVITASVDPGNIVEVKFTKGQSDGIYIETNVDNAGWTFAEKAVRSPAVFDVAANPANTPRGVQIRARFLDGNSAVGDWSDIVVVQTIP